MFDILVASRRCGRASRVWWSGPVVLVLHSALVGAAVWGTRRAAVARPVPVVFTVSPPPPDAGRAPRREAEPWRAPVLPPVVVPGTVGMPDIQITLDDLRFTPPGQTEWAGRGGPVGDGDDPLPVDLVDQRPEMLSAPRPAYPERLRRLGVEGLVTIRVIVDTNGRVGPASMTIVAAAHPDFVAPVRETLGRALFRPARAGGRAVRVFVEIPFAFRLARDR